MGLGSYGQGKILIVKMATPTNATGWNELFNGQLISAVFTMYDTALLGWTVAILFFVYQFMLLMKTKNLTLSWVTGIIFLALYATTFFVKTMSLQVMFILLAFELGGILYFILWK